MSFLHNNVNQFVFDDYKHTHTLFRKLQNCKTEKDKTVKYSLKNILIRFFLEFFTSGQCLLNVAADLKES